MRFISAVFFLSFVLAGVIAAPCAAQGLGAGVRISSVRGDAEANTVSQRFNGGQVRMAIGRRTTIEVALDVRTETSALLTERVRDRPVQASLLLFPIRSSFSPYVLGGIGWYSRRVEQLAGKDVVSSITTRKTGPHAGFGAELRLGRRAGVHGDYRYTMLNYDNDGGTVGSGGLLGIGLPTRFLPNYKGSMWTAGLTVYF